MNAWSHGYNVSSGYTYGFYRELAPDWLDFCALIQGYVAPARGAKGAFRYLELGSGQGFGLCLIAAANPAGHFVGIDFNPEHIAHSRQLAAAAGLKNIEFHEGDFAVLGAAWPAELGQFDYVTLHGIYSWVPEPVRAALVTCIGAATMPGSLVYVSYNTLPGWLSTVPFQHMARRLQVAYGRSGPAALDDAARLFQAIETTGSPLSKSLPALKVRLDGLKAQNSAYLVQEYLHDNWQPMWFSQAAGELSSIKLSYVGAAHLPEALMPSLLPTPMRDIVTAQDDPMVRQDVLDCVLNQGFRRDVYCRGPRKPFARGGGPLLDVRLRLAGRPQGDEVKVATTVGEAKIAPETVTPIMAALEQGPRTVGQLATLPGLPQKDASSNIQTLILLVHAGVLQIVARGEQPADAAQRLNLEIAAAAAEGAPYAQLAAPVLGSAIAAADVDLILLRAWQKNPRADAATLGRALCENLARLGRGISREGQVLAGEELAARARELANLFLTSQLPRWKELGAVR